MKLTVIGCSPAWPNPAGAQSGYLVEGTGRLLLDCGPGVLSRLRERESWPNVDAVVITHFHLDHWGDLVPWI
ncbi:MAG TPA: MBL fold metallo-hydrolase, partial [Gaiellaceae bacterium]|nr:MBL fold metallo-hydrolase [Gaiellaceae bacterium]